MIGIFYRFVMSICSLFFYGEMMPRPKKKRRICCSPTSIYFKPRAVPLSNLKISPIHMDELEAIKLADFDKLSHEQGASKMKISRATFGRILETARFKVADALLNGKAIEIITINN